MKNKIIKLLLALFLLPGILLARADDQKSKYMMAQSMEKAGEYAKAESLYVDLFSSNPNNYNYYNRYRNVLIMQRKYNELLPVVEKRLEKRQYDNYLKLESGILHYILKETDDAKRIWREVLKDQNSSMRNSYATAIYQDAMEYRIGNEFYMVTDILRSITKDQTLLVTYNFAVALRYRNWDKAVDEIMHIITTDVKDLRYVRQYIFTLEPLSAFYPRAIHALEKSDSPYGLELLSDIYIHTGEFNKAYDLLNKHIENDYMLEAMIDFAKRMFKQDHVELAMKAAKRSETFIPIESAARSSMALLGAQAEEKHFYQLNEQPGIVSYPFESEFLKIDFVPFDQSLSPMIHSAYETFDSLADDPGLIGEIAALHHADIAYRVYQDFDQAMMEYMKLISRKSIHNKSQLIGNLSKLMLAKGEYDRALEFIKTAPLEYGLMVHEEDQLLAHELFVSLIAGEKDSIVQRTKEVLAMLPLDDLLYNDILALTAVSNMVFKDSLNYDAWLKAERYILMNNTASAIDIYTELLNKNAPAAAIYGLRYLDCLHTQRDSKAEEMFWTSYYEQLSESDLGDYFMLRYASFMEKMQKFDISYEIFEKYLLSYQESMYYEHIREYVREHYSLGAP